MKMMTRISFMSDDGERVFGEGPWRLLRAVEQEGSLRAGAQRMNMAYTKALRLLRHAEEAFGQELTTRSIGGSNGGGSTLTAYASELLNRYEQCRNACEDANQAIFARDFPEFCRDEEE